MENIFLNDYDFSIIQKIVFKEIGISLKNSKKKMVENRLFKRLRHYQLDNFSSYIKIVQLSKSEKSEFLNNISTNETYFFREIEHFNFLKKLSENSSSLRIWSAASSIGAEAYSISMILDSNLNNWEVIGTDINTHVLEIAKKGLYQKTFLEKIPKEYQERYCLIGRNQYKNKMLVDRKLCGKTTFFENNLLYQNQDIGKFDVIFLRNVLLYFTEDTKVVVIKNLLNNLRTGGFLIIGMTDYINLDDIDSLTYTNNSIYRKV